MKEIVSAELRNPGNHGDSFCYKFQFHDIDAKGLDEELAEAVDKYFYESYKRWKLDHPNASTRQQVNLPCRRYSNSSLDSPVGE